MSNKLKKILFIDRDGVLLEEPEDEQIDSIDKIRFPKNMLSSLSKIVIKQEYLLVMVSNQDGLGTSSFPEKTFWPIQELLLRTLGSIGIQFDEIHIDRSFPLDRSPYRKPGIAMLTKYLSEEYDLKNSFVIGDRYSDMELAVNLGCQAIFYKHFDNIESKINDSIALCTNSWLDIEQFINSLNRTSEIIRNTDETKIRISTNIDGSGKSRISTGLPFFNHMLDQISKHSGIDLQIKAEGDLEIDEHHTIEDTAIALGQALRASLSKKIGIQRYGFALPMDDCRAQVLIDIGGRAWFEWDVEFKREKIGDFPTEMFIHFFHTLSIHAEINLQIKAYGNNEHHKIESIFKAFARAIKMAIKQDQNDFSLPSTKGMI